MTASVSLTTAEGAVAPGEEVVATVTVGGDGGTRLRAELFYVNACEFPVPESGSGGAGTNTSTLEMAVDIATEVADGPTETREDYIVVATAEPATAAGSVPPGVHEVRLAVPADAPSTAGELVRWKVRAMLDRTAGASEEAVCDVRVAATPAIGAIDLDPKTLWAEGVEVIVAGGSGVVRAGDTVRGTVAFTLPKSIAAQEVRIELQAHRKDHGRKRTTVVCTETIAGKTKLEAGTRTELPFALAVPADALPSFGAQHNRIDHLLAVSVDRKLRTDLNAIRWAYVLPS